MPGNSPPKPEQGFLGQSTEEDKNLAATVGEEEESLPVRPLVAEIDGMIDRGARGPGPEAVGRVLVAWVAVFGSGELLGLLAAAGEQHGEAGGGEQGEQEVAKHVSERAECDWRQRGR